MHYLVFVFVPATTDNILEEVSRLLDGSNQAPEKQFSTFEEKCACINFIASRDSMNQFDASEEGRELQAKLREARERNDTVVENEVLLLRFKSMRQIEVNHPLYMKVDPNCDICFGKGVFELTRDPSTHWDYWGIGGRWDGLFADFSVNSPNIPSDLQGNIAYVHDIQLTIEPAVIVTPEGEWYEGPLVIYDELFEPERSEVELQPRKEWSEQVREFYAQYSNFLAVVIDSHF